MNFELQAPIRECKDIIFFLYVILRGEESEQKCLQDFTWEKAVKMMTELKQLIDECMTFELERLEKAQWKIKMIEPYIDNNTIDEQVMVTKSIALSYICTWLTSIIESFKTQKRY